MYEYRHACTAADGHWHAQLRSRGTNANAPALALALPRAHRQCPHLQMDDSMYAGSTTTGTSGSEEAAKPPAFFNSGPVDQRLCVGILVVVPWCIGVLFGSMVNAGTPPPPLAPPTCADSQRKAEGWLVERLFHTEPIRCPWLVVPAASGGCVDDPTGAVAGAGQSCPALLPTLSNNCDFDLSTLAPAIPAGTTLGTACPLSCNACGALPPAPSASGGAPQPDAACLSRIAELTGFRNALSTCADPLAVNDKTIGHRGAPLVAPEVRSSPSRQLPTACPGPILRRSIEMAAFSIENSTKWRPFQSKFAVCVGDDCELGYRPPGAISREESDFLSSES